MCERAADGDKAPGFSSWEVQTGAVVIKLPGGCEGLRSDAALNHQWDYINTASLHPEWEEGGRCAASPDNSHLFHRETSGFADHPETQQNQNRSDEGSGDRLVSAPQLSLRAMLVTCPRSQSSTHLDLTVTNSVFPFTLLFLSAQWWICCFEQMKAADYTSGQAAKVLAAAESLSEKLQANNDICRTSGGHVVLSTETSSLREALMD